jgi:hypothetical protein
MRKSKVFLGLSAAAALVAAPLMTATASSAASGSSNTGGSVAGDSSYSAPATDLAKCKKIKQPSGSYVSDTKLVDLSGIADFTPVDKVGKVSFSPTVEKRSVPSSWASWGAPPDTESATPNILYTAGSTSLTVKIKGGAKTAGFEAEPNPFDPPTIPITGVFSKGGQDICTVTVDAAGQSGAKLLAVKSKKEFDTITVTSEFDFAIAQVRYK